ncbi:MAG: sulfite exporter TauE/SafE family protein [Desulfobulbaceae bacterium]|nr:sulfite exporter TauE/SafE family protein [Desulfobulbaceae bacterium]
MTLILLTYIGVGLVAGILAGLLGIGGGLVIVPMLVFCLNRQMIPPEFIMHIALATSMSSIIFTSISSFRAHHKRGAVRWDIVRRIVPGILVGTFLGTCLASRLPSTFLKGFFVAFLYFVALQMLLDKKPAPSREFPGQVAMFGVGGGIGVISSLVGIGGGTLSVPFMVWCNLALHHAIGTSAAIGFPIAVAGAIGYIANSLSAQGLPSYSLGYVYLPALLGIVSTSMLTAPLGVRLAHSLPVAKLKRVFALMLLIVGTRMLVSLLG